MKKIRVLLVDDAVVIRRMLTDVLSSDLAIEVAGTAPNGRIGLTRIAQLNPDLVIMDIEMPEMDGLETLKELRKSHPRLPVIMFSTLTQRGATATLDALALGANDYVTKPANVGSVAMAIQRIREQLIPRIKNLCGYGVISLPSAPKTGPRLNSLPVTGRSPIPSLGQGSCRVDVIAIGISTGGPNALAEMMPAFPRDLPVPILIVQHMPPIFTRMLADRLCKTTSIRIKEGEEGDELKPGHAYVAPGDYHMEIVRQGSSIRLHMNQNPAENSCRPAVDVLFRSVSAIYRSNVLGVVMTGMGQDGLKGCEMIRQGGGQIVVQDEASSVVWGMPGIVARSGLADGVYPLRELGDQIVRCVRRGRQAVAV